MVVLRIKLKSYGNVYNAIQVKFKKKIKLTGVLIADAKLQSVVLDIYGPCDYIFFQKKKHTSGNFYILTIVDIFSRNTLFTIMSRMRIREVVKII